MSSSSIDTNIEFTKKFADENKLVFIIIYLKKLSMIYYLFPHLLEFCNIKSRLYTLIFKYGLFTNNPIDPQEILNYSRDDYNELFKHLYNLMLIIETPEWYIFNNNLSRLVLMYIKLTHHGFNFKTMITPISLNNAEIKKYICEIENIYYKIVNKKP